MINPQWLRSFATLASEGNFTRTADQLGLTQAAVSQHIRHLEDEHGILLIRRPRSVELTPAGKVMLQYWQDMQLAHERMQHRMADHEALAGEVRLITPGSVGLLLYRYLIGLQAQTPSLRIHHRFAPDAEVEQSVVDGCHELGVLPYQPEDSRLESRLFCMEPLELVVPAGADVTGWKDLKALGYIGHPDGKAMATRLLARVFPGCPSLDQLPCRGFVNQISLILEPVVLGLGFTVIPRYARQAFANQEGIQVVPASVVVRDSLYLIHRNDWPLSRRAEFVIGSLHQSLCEVDGYFKPPCVSCG